MSATASRPRRVLLPVGDGFVHGRSMGFGPAVVMLHECPRSSLSLLPLMRELASRFTCIALDTPGYGESSPLPTGASLEDFAERMLAALDSIPLPSFMLYGTHTGAAISVAMALRAPRRVSRLFLDGPAAFLEEEKKSLFAHYLPPIGCRRDGAHLATLWTRVVDQQVFFPFYRRHKEARAGGSGRDLLEAHRSALGFLMAGEHYRTAYRAAIDFPMADAVGALSDVPCTITCLAKDMLVGHLERLPIRGRVLHSPVETTRAVLQGAGAVDLPLLTQESLAMAQAPSQRYQTLAGAPVRCWMAEHFQSCDSFSLRHPLGRAQQSPLDLDLPAFGASADGTEWGFSTAKEDPVEQVAVSLKASFDDSVEGCRAFTFLLRALSLTPPALLERLYGDTALARAAIPWCRSLPEPDWGGGHLHALWVFARELVEDTFGGSPFYSPGEDRAQLAMTNRLFLYLLKSLPALRARTQSQ